MIANSYENSNGNSINELAVPGNKKRESSFLSSVRYSLGHPLEMNKFIARKSNFLNPRISGQSNNSLRKAKKIHKYVQPLWIFFINVLIACVISLQNIYLIYGKPNDTGRFALISFIGLVIVISIVNSLYVVDFKTLLKMYFMMDNILLAQLTADIGLIGTYLVASTGNWTQYAIMFGIPISFFFFVGNFRVCVRFSNWKKWRIIPFKFSLMVGAICFFQIGAYFMTVNYSYSGGENTALDSKVKDFILLYAFGTFDFFMQLFAKISDFDQTAQLKYVYELKAERQISSEAGSQNKIDSGSQNKMQH